VLRNRKRHLWVCRFNLEPGVKVPISARTEQRRVNNTYHSVATREPFDAFLWRYGPIPENLMVGMEGFSCPLQGSKKKWETQGKNWEFTAGRKASVRQGAGVGNERNFLGAHLHYIKVRVWQMLHVVIRVHDALIRFSSGPHQVFIFESLSGAHRVLIRFSEGLNMRMLRRLDLHRSMSMHYYTLFIGSLWSFIDWSWFGHGSPW
jgi:hypothetical protein